MGMQLAKYILVLIIGFVFGWLIPTCTNHNTAVVKLEQAMLRENDSLQKDNEMLQIEKNNLLAASLKYKRKIDSLKSVSSILVQNYNKVKHDSRKHIVNNPCDSVGNVIAVDAIINSCDSVINSKDSIIVMQEEKMQKDSTAMADTEKQLQNTETIAANNSLLYVAKNEELKDTKQELRRQKFLKWAGYIIGTVATGLTTYFAIIKK